MSLFFDWYSYKVFNENNELVAAWNYNLFSGWSTPITCCLDRNDLFRPEDLSVPVIITIILVITIIASGYITIFKNFDNNTISEKTRYYSQVYIILIALNFFYYFLFPVFFLFPKGLFFPFLEYEDFMSNYLHCYSIGLGYFFNLIAFMFIFPYAFFFIKTVSQFEKEGRSPEKVLDHHVQESREPLHLDRLIIEEEVRLNSNANKNKIKMSYSIKKNNRRRG